jgi:hypothetical protein
MFSFGRSTGVAESALYLSFSDEQIYEVWPQRWQNFYRQLLAIPKEQPFDSRTVASKIVPDYAPQVTKRKLDHGTGDAILLATWRLLELNSEMQTLQSKLEPLCRKRALRKSCQRKSRGSEETRSALSVRATVLSPFEKTLPESQKN